MANSEKPVYAGTYEDQLKDLYDRIQNREEFSYDVNKDALYQMYKDQYTKQGQLAMKDTIGQGAMLTGGYDNSYAQQVGQQAYNGYMDKLNGVIPDLYNMAYNRYQDEGDDLLTQYSLLGDLRDNEYNRYQDELSNWRYDDETAYDRGRDAIADQRYEDETAYDRGRDAISDQRYNDETAYNRQQDAYSNLVAMIKLTGYTPTASELAAAGMSSEQARALSNQWISENILPDSTSTSGGGYSSGGSYSSGGGYSSGGSGYDANTAAIQQQLNAMGAGLDVDGIWGPKTQAAYEKYITNGNKSFVSVPGSKVVESSFNGNKTRGQIQREAEEKYKNGELTYAEYRTIIKGLH